MSVSAEMYLVISLMFAVFAAVAAVGTSLVLGVGFERLRAGFEIVRKQTGFFADAIHKLDQRTQSLGAETGKLKETVSALDQKVSRVEGQTAFFADAIHGLERLISERPVPAEIMVPEHAVNADDDIGADMGWIVASAREALECRTDQLLETMPFIVPPPAAEQNDEPRVAAEISAEETRPGGLTNLLTHYLQEERRVVYH